MSNKALDEFFNKKPQNAPVNRPATEQFQQVEQSPTNEPDEIDFRAYGANRSGRQAIMLDIRKQNEQRLALSYSYLNTIYFDPSGVIILIMDARTIRIEGRNLKPVYEKMLSHSVRYIQQLNPELEQGIPADETFISSIEMTEPE